MNASCAIYFVWRKSVFADDLYGNYKSSRKTIAPHFSLYILTTSGMNVSFVLSTFYNVERCSGVLKTLAFYLLAFGYIFLLSSSELIISFQP